MTKRQKSKRRYHVKVYTCTYDDDGMLLVKQLVHEQDTWAVSERKAECNARFNSGQPYCGNAEYDGGNWLRTIECEVTQHE